MESEIDTYQNEKLKEFEEFIRFRKVAIIGMGVSNLPLLDYFHEKKARVTIFDSREISDMPKDVMDKTTEYAMEFSLGKNYLSKLQNFDLIIRSPSCLPTIPEIMQEEERGAIVATEIELFMRMCPCKMIGVTGSDGKTTTTTLIAEIVKAGGYVCHTGGNIGVPLFTKLKDVRPEDIAVLELSSFQLMGMEISPDISVLTNITPNHLNVHKDYEEYIEAKKNIFRFQNKDGILVTNFDNDITKEASIQAPGKVIYFSSNNKLNNGYIIDDNMIKKCDDKIRKHLINTKDIIIRGKHNYENICAALAATSTLVDIDTAIKVCENFKGVEHRIEFVKEINGTKWYNDSASSTPSRTISGLNAFDEEIVLIAGGADKNLDYTPIAKPILEKVKVLILMGETSDKIFNAVKKEQKEQEEQREHREQKCQRKQREQKEQDDIKICMCNSLNQAVILAKRYSKPGQVVLFSPASTSFDMFKNMYDRGNQFKAILEKL